MRVRNWLMTGTSLGLMTIAPLPALAQDTTIPPELPQQCIDAGITDFEACIVAMSAAPGEQPIAPTEAPAPEANSPDAPAPEAAPQPAAEPAPAPEPAPAIEAPAPEQPVAEPAPEATPAPQPETAAQPESASEPAPQPEPIAEAVPNSESPTEPTQQPAPTPAAAPAAEEQPAAEPASGAAPTEEPAPEIAPAQEPAQPAAPSADIAGALQAQIDIYNSAIADMMSGGDTTAAQAKIDGAKAEIAALCTSAGYADATSCLAAYGLELPVVPAVTAPIAQPESEPTSDQSAPQTPADQPSEPATDQPAAAETPTEQTTPQTPKEQPAAEQPTELIGNLPEGITEEQVAPVLDSAKDNEATPVEDQPVAEQPAAAAKPEAPIAPPPETDAAAQAEFAIDESAEVSATQEPGQKVTAAEVVAPVLPPSVTVVNTTNITNTTINNTTNNTQNNTQNNIEQQNNVEINDMSQTVLGDQLTQVILKVGSQLFIDTRGQDTSRYFDNQADEVFYETLDHDRVRETITRPDGTQIVTVRNRNGDVLRRSRISPDGHETVLAYFNYRYSDELLDWHDPALDLPPLHLNIPVQDYVLDASNADADEVAKFFSQPPVEEVARLYSIGEVKRSARVRDSVRKLVVGGLTFDTGEARISRDQVGALSNVANAMLALLDANPAETFLIEGHTDAIGSDISNLKLSDLRAATVARILTDFYHVPPENLVTQGYGERYLRIRTQAAERANRRVTIRRITPLITVANK